jgi:hypothetical protein
VEKGSTIREQGILKPENESKRLSTRTIIMSTTQTITVQAVEETPQKWMPGPPLKLSGALNSYKSFDVSPVIGKEFVDVNLKDWVRAPNSDELIRDLAITSTYI